MLRLAVASALAATAAAAAASVDPAVWPAPASGSPSGSAWNRLSSSVSISVKPEPAPPGSVLSRGVARYQEKIVDAVDGASDAEADATVDVTEIAVTVGQLDAPWEFPVDESYNVSTRQGDSTVVVSAVTQWGALRALETVLQLVEGARIGGQPAGVPTPLAIRDAPRFGWRGVMMDFGRHFYTVGFIKKTMDAMEANKMNVLHLHITDDQSFPMQSDAVPELAEKGAFHPSQIYSAADVADLVAYGTDRGIHIVPEFDMPAHTAAWGAGRPDIMITGDGCSPAPFNHGDVMDPTTDVTFETLDALLAEQSSRFGGSFFHLGGDEVPTTCWTESAKVKAWMAKQGFKTPEQIESYFVNRVKDGPKFSAHNQNLVYWQEIFQNNVTLHPSTVIQAWKTDVMPDVMKAGYRVTNSYGWYLNHGCDNFGDGNWDKFYTNEPTDLAPNTTPAERKLLLGGEVTMWSECVDEHIFEAIVWLRAAAAAEKMWSPESATKSASAAVATRLALHRCRMLGRNITAEPLNDSGGDPRSLNPACP